MMGAMDKPIDETQANFPSLEQLEAGARRLLIAKVLRKGGKQPSNEALELAVKTLARRAFSDSESKRLSRPSGNLDR